jgi:lipopolysaccharide transport system ATP-binding protein
MRPIIKVENLGKQYRLGARRARYGTLRESIAEALNAPLKRFKRNGNSAEDTIWALKDVSFEVMPGEVLGIIGRNGAGKSTLLKILSRITEPTTGGVDLYGRVGSLLEVGTGFHPELTGRENIYLNGSILGMKRAEMQNKLDEIVAFAELEKFIDTPVKHYSSGMYVRLAFAVAAHLEPEILLVDEVLAVGDAQFQSKCLGKMEDVAQEGRTVLFVSHNMGAIEKLCSQGMVIENGMLKFKGVTSAAVDSYILKHVTSQPTILFSETTRRKGSGEGRITKLEVLTQDGRPAYRIKTSHIVRLAFTFESEVDEPRVGAGILIRDKYDRYVIDMRSSHSGSAITLDRGRRYLFEAEFRLALYPGQYIVGIWVKSANNNDQDIDYIPEALELTVEDNEDLLRDGRLNPQWGQFFTESQWRMQEEDRDQSRRATVVTTTDRMKL